MLPAPENPYLTPSSEALPEPEVLNYPLASRNQRLNGAVIDWILFGLIRSLITAIPPVREWLGSSFGIILIGSNISLTLAVWLMLHGWRAATKGQTIGKALVKTRIVTMDGRQAPLSTILLGREGFRVLLSAIPVVGPYLFLAEPLLIFREDRRCLHDWVAGTKVVTLAPPPLAFKPTQKIEIVRKPAPIIAAGIRRHLDLDPAEIPLDASWRSDLRIPAGVLGDFLEPLADAFPAISRREIERCNSLRQLLALFEISPEQFQKTALLKASGKSADS